MQNRSTKTDYDVVVVGARCAGAATARLLARAGLDVLVVDRTRLPADTVSTHALMLAGIVQLRRWELLAAVAGTGATPIDAIEMSVGSVAFTAGVKDIGGVDRLYAPRRVVLDALLLDAARAAGAEVRTGVNVTGVTRDSASRVTGVTGSTHDGGRFEVSARWIVGADGVRSTVAELVNSPVELFVEPANSCHYAYWSGVDGHHYIFAFAPGVGVGAIPSDDGLTCVFVNCPVGEVGRVRRHLDSEFRRLLDVGAPALSAQVGQGTRVSGYRGTRGLPGYLRTPVGPGWLLVGDAGYHRDPYSAHGITDAFRDAELAARAIRDAAADHTRETDALREYRIRRNDFAVPMFHATAKVASYEWSIDELLDILAGMGEEGEREARFLANLPELSPMRRQGAA